jgi:hypothetical protein
MTIPIGLRNSEQVLNTFVNYPIWYNLSQESNGYSQPEREYKAFLRSVLADIPNMLVKPPS